MSFLGPQARCLSWQRLRFPEPWDRPGLQRLQDRIRPGDVELAAVIDVQCFHHAVLDHHGVTLRAHAEAGGDAVELQADRLGEIAAAIGQEFDLAVPPVALAQACMTKTSLTEVTATVSTPLALKSS